MKPTAQALYQELLIELGKSTGEQRAAWVQRIVTENMDLGDFTDLLMVDPPVSTRFSWMLSELGVVAPEKLRPHLSHLFAQREQVKAEEFAYKFGKYWLLAGIPEQDEGLAVDLLLNWLGDPVVKIYHKHYILKSLMHICELYPGLREEVRLVIEAVQDMHTATFRKQVLACLARL